MKILLVGDLHLRAKKLKDIATAWNNVVNWAHKNKVDLICQVGDVFDHANVYGREASTGTIFGSFLEPFVDQENPVPLLVIPGNHDLGSPKDKDALSPVDRYPWINVVRKPYVVPFNDKLAVCCVPWLNRVHLISRLLAKGTPLEDATKQVNSVIAKLMSPLAEQVKQQKDLGRFTLFIGHLEVTGAKLTDHVQENGSFEFSPANLASIGADAYALAHIHIRQHIEGLPNPNDGYLGCLCQLSFGEEGNAVGCRLLEIEDRKIVTDRWMDNLSSPKYFTLESLDGAKYRAGVDYVKYRSADKPDNLPQGVIFERLPKTAQTRLRTDEKLDCDQSLRTLLTAWKNVSGAAIDLDQLVTEAERLYSLCQLPQEAIGSLERIERVKLKNFTCHGLTDIKLDVSGICGIAGPNGSGKTTAIEAIMLGIYGLSPSHPQIQTMVPRGDPVESAVEVQFISAGKRYVARREFHKTKRGFTQKLAQIHEMGNDKAMASGVEGCFGFATSQIGDSDLVLAGIFSSQGDSGNLVKQKPAQRKDLFAKLLGTEKFLIISELAKKLSAAAVVAVQAQRGRLETIRMELGIESQDKEKLNELIQDIAVKQNGIEKAKKALEGLQEQIMQKGLEKQAQANIAETINELEARRVKLIEHGSKIKTQKLELEGLDSKEIEAAMVKVKAFKEEAQALSTVITEQSQKQLIYEREFNALKEERATKSKEIWDKLVQFRAKADKITQALTAAKHRAGLIDGFPDLPECQTCPLAADSVASRNSIPELEKELADITARITKGEQVFKQFKEETDTLIAAKRASFVGVDLSELTQQMNVANLSAHSLISEFEPKQEMLASAKAEISKMEGQLIQARKEVKELMGEIELRTKELANCPYDVEGHKKLVNANIVFNDQIRTLSTELANINVDIGRYKAKLEQHDARRLEINSLEKDIREKESKTAVHEALVQACGRDGIPQLIVDSAIPHLQEIMFDMMSEIDGKWTIRIATQRETGKGTVQERIDILVDDGEDERDIATYSGGEMNLLSTIIRIAFSILQAERSGKGLKVLVLDEAMYFADNEYSDAFMRMLRKLPKFFNQIFVISHSEFILSSIQNKLFFTKGVDGKSVVQADFSEKTE